MMDAQYNIEEWAAATTLGRHIFNYNYRMVGNELKGWELVNSVLMENEPGVTEKVYIWQKKGSDAHASIRVSIIERHHWRDAQNQLHDQLWHSMRPNIPKGTGKLGKIGDINFIGQESDVVAAILFTRGNISVSVSSVGDKLVDVSSVAKILDHNFSEPPKEEEIKEKRAGIILPRSLQVKEKESATVVEKLPEPTARSGWLKIIAPDGELRRQDDALVYVPATTGKKKIGKYVVMQ